MKNIKNYNEFINENYDDDREIEVAKQTKINNLERELFFDIINNLINSNNVKKMNEFVNYLTGKISLSLTQFIHQQIYKLRDKNIVPSDIDIDYDNLNKKIKLFKDTVSNL